MSRSLTRATARATARAPVRARRLAMMAEDGQLARIGKTAALIASGTAFALSRPDSPPTRALSPGVILQPNRYCYNWDFLNNTGDDANGLRIRLAGIQTVTDIYTGTLNTFGEPDSGSGYISRHRSASRVITTWPPHRASSTKRKSVSTLPNGSCTPRAGCGS